MEASKTPSKIPASAWENHYFYAVKVEIFTTITVLLLGKFCEPLTIELVYMPSDIVYRQGIDHCISSKYRLCSSQLTARHGFIDGDNIVVSAVVTALR